jgi:hypothetical protein
MTTTEWARAAERRADTIADPTIGVTLRAALKARSIFLRRELMRAIAHHECAAPLGALVLGGSGFELLECAERHRENGILDFLLVSDGCDPEVVAESIAWPLDTMVRIGVRRYSPIDYLLDDDATAARPRDVVLFDSVLDELDDATAVRALAAALLRVRRGGIVVGATFDHGIASVDPAGFEATLGPRAVVRSYAAVAEMVAAIPNPNFRAGILERGPNRWIVLERT